MSPSGDPEDMEGVQRVPVPTPFEVGRVNCYCFEGGELTLLDPGPATEEALEAVETGLAEAGHDLAAVDRVVVTHPHMDHYGLARRVVEASGARVLAHADAVDHLADPLAYFEREQAFFRPFLLSMGVPEQIVDTVVSLPESYTEFQEPVDVDRTLGEGDRVEAGDRRLEVVETPGHAPGSVCLLDADEAAAFTGDHVLEHVSPNPLLTLAPGTDDERTRSLPTYLDSLRHLRRTDATVGHPGHGETVTDLPGRIESIRDHHRHRKERIDDLLAAGGPATAYELMQELFPDLPVTEMFPGMSEVIGHLDLLEEEDRIQIREQDGLRRYAVE